jgi:phosphonate transport system substrate-binding protein
LNKKIIKISLLMLLSLISFSSCSKKKTNTDKIVVVWLPNDSSDNFENARQIIDETITRATGKQCQDICTTDYAIVVEALASNKAAICYGGAQSYIDVHAKNDQVVPLVVRSGVSGTADDAMYYSWLAVNSDKVIEYQNADGSLNAQKLAQKRISFVSSSSTSGFSIPVTYILGAVKSTDKWANLTPEDLMEGGKDKFFSEVMFGGSHQVAMLNLLMDRSDIAASCNIVGMHYAKAIDGLDNVAGTKYIVTEKAEAPFDTVIGKEFTLLEAIPVMNAPIMMNKNLLTETEQQKLIEFFTSDEVANDERMFPTEQKTGSSFAVKKGNDRFVHVEDTWFDPLRKISSNTEK